MDDVPRNLESSVVWSDRVVKCPQCGKTWRLTYAAALRDDWADSLTCCPLRPRTEPPPDRPHFLSGPASEQADAITTETTSPNEISDA
jgi:hypothetical protein